MFERVFICTTKERFLSVLEVVESFVESIEGPTDWDSGYLFTLNVPKGVWESLKAKLAPANG